MAPGKYKFLFYLFVFVFNIHIKKSKLTIKTPKRHHWCHSGAFIVNFECFLQLAGWDIQTSLFLLQGTQYHQKDLFEAQNYKIYQYTSQNIYFC